MAFGSLTLTQGLGTSTLPGPGSLIVTGYLGGASSTPPPPPTPPGTGVLVQEPLSRIGVGGGGIDDGIDLIARKAFLAWLYTHFIEDKNHVTAEKLETSIVVDSIEVSIVYASAETGVNIGQHDAANTLPPALDSSVDVSELDVSIDGDDTND